MHMDALVALVRLRGGLEYLGFGGLLQMFISRYVIFDPGAAPMLGTYVYT